MKQYRIDRLDNGLWGLMEAENESAPWEEVYIGTDRLFAHTREEMEGYIRTREATTMIDHIARSVEKTLDPGVNGIKNGMGYKYKRMPKDTSQVLSGPVQEG